MPSLQSQHPLHLYRPTLPVWTINLGITLLAAALWPLGVLLEDQLDPYFLRVIVLPIGINVILASSLNLINGITGQFSLGHAGFMAIGAYTAGVLMKHHDPQGAALVPAIVGTILLGGILAAAAGLVIGIPTLRLRGDYLAIATLGFAEIINVVIVNTESIAWMDVGGSSGLHGIPRHVNFFWIYLGALVCVVTVWRLSYSAKGKAFLAVREDEIAAAAMGIDTTFYKVAAFVIGSFFAGVAGALAAMFYGNIAPGSFGFMRSVEIVVMVVLGGSGSVTGSIVAAAILTTLPEGLRFMRGDVKEWRLIIYALILIFMMLLRPEGVFGRRELWWTRRVLKPRQDKGAPAAV